MVKILALAGVLAGLGASPVLAADFTPSLTFTADPFTVVGGDAPAATTYVHVLAGGGSLAVSNQWSVTVQGAWTAGTSLSDKAVGDIQGVQGAFNRGNQVWLYQLMATGTFDKGSVSVGRLSSGDAFGALEVMDQFANSAFASNGGAISINDPGRANAPASSWGATGTYTPTAAVTVKGGAFLSDPDLFAGGVRPRRFAFRPARGVLGFAEADLTVAKGWTVGLGGYADTGRFTTFAGRPVRGEQGWYATLDGALIAGATDKAPPKLEGFMVVQRAPRADRSLEPLFLAGGLVLNGPWSVRPKDALAFAVESAQLSRQAGGGSETTLEANYRFALNSRCGLRPDLQYVIGAGGNGRNVWVAGLQIDFSL